MPCTHPVLYSRNGVLYCQICGATLPLEHLTAKNKPPDKPTRKGKKTKGD